MKYLICKYFNLTNSEDEGENSDDEGEDGEESEEEESDAESDQEKSIVNSSREQSFVKTNGVSKPQLNQSSSSSVGPSLETAMMNLLKEVGSCCSVQIEVEMQFHFIV